MPRKSEWTALEDAALKAAYTQQLEQLGRAPKGKEWDPIVAALPARGEERTCAFAAPFLPSASTRTGRSA